MSRFTKTEWTLLIQQRVFVMRKNHRQSDRLPQSTSDGVPEGLNSKRYRERSPRSGQNLQETVERKHTSQSGKIEIPSANSNYINLWTF